MADGHSFLESAPSGLEWRLTIERLREDRETLVSEFLREFGESAQYATGLVSEDDLRTTSVDTVDYLIAHLSGNASALDLRLPQRLGARRARQGVPQDQLLAALRVNYRVIWRGLCRAASMMSTEILVDNVEYLLLAIEQYAREAQTSFLNEEASMHHDSRVRKERAIASLFNANLDASGALDSIARTLQLTKESTFELIFVPGIDAESLRTRLREGGGPSAHHLYEFPDGACAFRKVAPGRTWADLRLGMPSGYIPSIRGLHDVPVAAASASILAGHSSVAADSPTTLSEAWPHIAEASLHAAFPDFSGELRSKLRTLQPADLRHVIATVISYSETGSVKAVAERMFCHRNTVLKRLRIFSELTGVDLAVPRELAYALIALAPVEKELGTFSSPSWAAEPAAKSVIP